MITDEQLDEWEQMSAGVGWGPIARDLIAEVRRLRNPEEFMEFAWGWKTKIDELENKLAAASSREVWFHDLLRRNDEMLHEYVCELMDKHGMVELKQLFNFPDEIKPILKLRADNAKWLKGEDTDE